MVFWAAAIACMKREVREKERKKCDQHSNGMRLVQLKILINFTMSNGLDVFIGRMLAICQCDNIIKFDSNEHWMHRTCYMLTISFQSRQWLVVHSKNESMRLSKYELISVDFFLLFALNLPTSGAFYLIDINTQTTFYYIFNLEVFANGAPVHAVDAWHRFLFGNDFVSCWTQTIE